MSTTTVKDVMTTGPTSIANDAMVVEAARRMLAEDVGSLPVVDGDSLVGMITDRDVVLQVSRRISTRTRCRVERVLRNARSPPQPDEPLDDALRGWRRSRSAACRS